MQYALKTMTNNVRGIMVCARNVSNTVCCVAVLTAPLLNLTVSYSRNKIGYNLLKYSYNASILKGFVKISLLTSHRHQIKDNEMCQNRPNNANVNKKFTYFVEEMHSSNVKCSSTRYTLSLSLSHSQIKNRTIIIGIRWDISEIRSIKYP